MLQETCCFLYYHMHGTVYGFVDSEERINTVDYHIINLTLVCQPVCVHACAAVKAERICMSKQYSLLC